LIILKLSINIRYINSQKILYPKFTNDYRNN